MFRWIAPFIAGLLMISFASREALASVNDWQKGMSFATWWHGNYSTPEADESLELLTATGATWISLIVTCYQETVSSTTIECLTDSRTPTDADLVHVIQKAKSLGLKVMLKPHLDLNNDPDHWRGEINFGSDEAAWQAWFSSYRAMIVHYAQLAQAHGVDQFSVGVELEGTTHREADWRAIIAAVREVYSGPLTYAANYGGEEFSIAFWDALDLIGIDPYRGLTNKNDPTLEELKAGWSEYVLQLESLSHNWGKPILFTELGYRSIDGANRAPWDWQTDAPVDLQEQADCYQAFFEVFQDKPWVAGIFWWFWDVDPNQGGPASKDYTPHNKPAEAVLRSFFFGSTSAVFRVTSGGHVLADGRYYGATFQTGVGADLAERVDVLEPVEPGDVIEIDPQHPRRYRRARTAYSPLAVGVIASTPGITLGNAPHEFPAGMVDPAYSPWPLLLRLSFSPTAEPPLWTVARLSTAVGLNAPRYSLTHFLSWLKEKDFLSRRRPLLALLGRVYAKATTENGPIRPGDLLTTASKPGYAMRCPFPEECQGAILGKALEPLVRGEGLIQILLMP